MRKLDLRLLRLIKNGKGQFISITLVVILGLCIYLSFSMTAVNMKDTVDDYYEMTNFEDILVQVVKIPQNALKDLENIEGIEDVQGRVTFEVPLKVEDTDEKVRVRILSIPTRKKEINRLYMLEGKNIGDEFKNTVVLGQFAKARGINIGDKITPYINGKTYDLKVSGLAASPEYVYLLENEQTLLPNPENFGVIYVKEDFAQSVYGYNHYYNEVLIKIKNKADMDHISKLVEDTLDSYGVKRIIKREDQLSNRMLKEELKGLEKSAKTIPVLFLAVAAIILYIMLNRIVKKDRIAIGVLKALGHGNFSILSHYLKYAMSIGFIGSILGTLAGIFLSGLFTKVYLQFFNIPLLKLEIYYSYMFYGIILTSMFCMIGGFTGARTVLKIMPSDAMRPEYPSASGKILLEKIGFIWNKLSFSWKMVIRNVMRNKKRFFLLVLGVALTYGIIMVALFQFYVFTDIFNLQYGQFQRMDYTIDFSIPMNRKVVTELKHIVSYDKIEPKLEYPYEMKNGWRKKVVNIIGVPMDTDFYHFKDLSDERITMPKRGILVTEGLAKKLKVKKGDLVNIKNFIPDRDDVELEVKGIIQQYLGVNGYMNIEEMERLLAEKEMITGVSLTSKDHVEDKLKDVKNIRSVQSLEDMKNSFLEFMDSMIYSVGVMIIFGGILGFAIVYNGTVISISERTMEFSSLRVMGFEKKEIFKMIGRENGWITFIAILLGIPSGFGMCYGITKAFSTDIYTIPVIITPKIFIIAGIMTIGFVMIGQLATMRKIYKLNFMDGLKNRIS